jgi:hypothetical protein
MNALIITAVVIISLIFCLLYILSEIEYKKLIEELKNK